MRLIREESSFTHLLFSSKDGSEFITFSFYNPFSLNCYLLELSFEIDKAIPGVEFALSFIFFRIFYRKNKPEAMEYFDRLEKEIESGDMETYTMEEVMDMLDQEEGE